MFNVYTEQLKLL